MFNLYHNIKFEKFFGHITYVKDGIEKKYFPDFIQENTIIEIKGHWTGTVDVKADAARKKGFDIQILYKSDLKHHFEWFAETCPNNKLHEMFEDYKPNYEYNCNNCNKIFSSDRKRKTDLKFCSRICAGIHNSKMCWKGVRVTLPPLYLERVATSLKSNAPNFPRPFRRWGHYLVVRAILEIALSSL